MIDFPVMQENPSLDTWRFFGTVFILTVLLNYKTHFKGYGISSGKNKHYQFIFFVFSFIICAWYTGDWVHLQENVHNTQFSDYIAGFSLEKIYYYVIDFVNNNYLLFRIIVWGTGFTSLLCAFRIFKLNIYNAILFLFVYNITGYAYARAAVALSIFFLGFSIFYSSGKIKHRVGGLAFILLSLLFHRSMLILLMIFPMSLLTLSKKNLKYIVLGVLLFWGLQATIMSSLLERLMTSDDYANRIEFYGEVFTQNALGFNDMILMYWYKLTIYIPLFYCLYSLYKAEKASLSKQILKLYSFAFYLTIITFLMFIYYGESSPFYYRIEGMLYIPIVVLITYLFDNKIVSFKHYIHLFNFCCGYWFLYFFIRMLH